MAHICGRRFARARCTAACRHGLLPSTARSSTPASAQAPLYLCTWPSWAWPCRHFPLSWRHVAFKAPKAPAAGSSPAQADARQGLLHGRALLPSQGLEEVRRASCHCILLPWLQLCLACLSPVLSHTVRRCCSLFMHSLQVLAFCLTALRHAGAFEKSKSRKWPLNGVSDSV